MENEIVESEVLEMEVELEVFDEVAAAVEAAKERCANIILKYDTPQEIKDAKSFIYDIRLLKAPVVQAHKVAKAQLLKDGRAMDAKKNMLIGALEEMIDEKYAPIKLIEDAEAAEANRIEQERVEAEEAEQEKSRLELEAREKAVADQREELRKRQEELDRKEREARIAEEAKKLALVEAGLAMRAAAEKAKQDAINAENARKQAIVDAENAKAAAVQKAKDEAAAEAQAEKIKAARVAEHERVLAADKEMAETARVNNEKHRSEVHRAIYKAVLGRCVTAAAAKVLVEDLRDGKIPNVTINY